MKINTLKDFIKVVGAWKRNENSGRPTLPDLAIVYAWNDVPEEVMIDVISYYKYENISSDLKPMDLNDWKNKVLFNNE
jgi:hypothetical protein